MISQDRKMVSKGQENTGEAVVCMALHPEAKCDILKRKLKVCCFLTAIRKDNKKMSREEVFAKLNAVFCDVFDDEDIVIGEATTAEDIEDWDSLEHITLVAAVEAEFGVKFSMGQVVTLKNVGEMVDLILSKIA